MSQFEVFLKFLEVIGLLCTGVVSYGRLMTKIKELDMKIMALEQKLQSAEKLDDRVMNKLENISEKLNAIEIKLENKLDRP